jgi:hypothetical protein
MVLMHDGSASYGGRLRLGYKMGGILWIALHGI